jgi:hypothetical protein
VTAGRCWLEDVGADVGVAGADEGFFLTEVDLDAPAPEDRAEGFDAELMMASGGEGPDGLPGNGVVRPFAKSPCVKN